MWMIMRKPLFIASAVVIAAAAAIGSKIVTASAAEDPSLYQAEATTSTLTGGARIDACGRCSGRQKVGWVGKNKGVLTVTGVRAAAAGPATLTVSYSSAVTRSAVLRLNSGTPVTMTFPATGGWNTPRTKAVKVALRAGANTLAFGNPAGWAPDFDSVRVTRADASPSPSPSASPADPGNPVDPVTAYENEVYAIVNAERAKDGCTVMLTTDLRLAKAARDHSEDMAAKGYFDHTSPDGRTFAERITAAGYTWAGAGENIAKGQRTPAEVMRVWMNSSGHRANILNCGFHDLGVGLAYDARNTPIWTQDFGSQRPPR
jgi:uncharacterized protein YkwD